MVRAWSGRGACLPLVQALPVPGVLSLAGCAGRAACGARNVGAAEVDAAACACELERGGRKWAYRGVNAVQAEDASVMLSRQLSMCRPDKHNGRWRGRRRAIKQVGSM